MGAMIAAGAQLAQKANKQLQQGISPGVRASGPFAKQIAQAQSGQVKRNRQFMQTNKSSPNTGNQSKLAALAAAAMR